MKFVSEIQVRVDDRKLNGMYISTGSHQADLHAAAAQSLAGRAAMLKLLPLSLEETRDRLPFEALLYRGFYPRIVSRRPLCRLARLLCGKPGVFQRLVKRTRE